MDNCKNQAADDGNSEWTKESMQTALKAVAQVQELMECMCPSCAAAGKPSTHRWCHGTDLHLWRPNTSPPEAARQHRWKLFQKPENGRYRSLIIKKSTDVKRIGPKRTFLPVRIQIGQSVQSRVRGQETQAYHKSDWFILRSQHCHS